MLFYKPFDLFYMLPVELFHHTLTSLYLNHTKFFTALFIWEFIGINSSLQHEV